MELSSLACNINNFVSNYNKVQTENGSQPVVKHILVLITQCMHNAGVQVLPKPAYNPDLFDLRIYKCTRQRFCHYLVVNLLDFSTFLELMYEMHYYMHSIYVISKVASLFEDIISEILVIYKLLYDIYLFPSKCHVNNLMWTNLFCYNFK